MMRHPIFTMITLSISVSLVSSSYADSEKSNEAKSATFSAAGLSAIKLRNIGPALTSGRIADMAIDAAKPNTWYVAAGSGNVWKTVNAGTTWKPIFDSYGSYSIGCITIDPSNGNVIWVGTGENVSGRHVGYGDGIYKSLDGGKQFTNMGLKESEHISKIIVDPRDSNIVYVAVQGPLWSPGGERGLYKTTDGGTSWKCILSKGPYTGVTDIALDPRNSRIVYAATFQHHRTVWGLVNGGPESGLYKSTDGGKTWTEMKKGLPGGDKGKIALAVSPVKPDVVYASIELAKRKGGFWRSADGGQSWSKMSDSISGGTGPHYYQEIYCDPHRFDVVYQADVGLKCTEDGGKTWQSAEGKWKHCDNHAVVFHPHDSDFLLVGTDGGLFRSFDRGKTYQHFHNLPLTQFYKLGLGYDGPFYHMVGGTQDNTTQYGPCRTPSKEGISNSDWKQIIGGDGYDCAIDPVDPNIIYGEAQNGDLIRFDRKSGQSVDISPRPEKGEDDLRFNWDAPFLISPHNHKRLYSGSKKLHRSDDRGDSWITISPDLSLNQDRYKLKHMDRVWSVDALHDLFAMSKYGNITSISESAVQEGLLYVGTDDGLIQVTEDGGKNWRKVEKIYGVPQFAFVNDIKADRLDADTVYAVFDNHKMGDFKPYLVKSTDRGRTWNSITGDLPDRQILWRFEQDHVDPKLCFLAAEFGLYVSVDGGQQWVQLKGNVPTIAFRDIELQRQQNDLVAASFGRSIFVLDDYSFLRHFDPKDLEGNAFLLFNTRPALLHDNQPANGGNKWGQGASYFMGPNPPFGAVFTYYLKESLKTQKQIRRERESKVKKSGGDNIYPGWDAMTEEQRESPPAITLIVKDSKGKVVRRINAPTSAGFHRVAWDLHYYPMASASGSGPLVATGKYTVAAEKRIQGKTTSLCKDSAFEVVSVFEPSLSSGSSDEAIAYYKKAATLLRSVRASAGRTDEVLEQLEQIKKALDRSGIADAKLLKESESLRIKLTAMRETLAGRTIKVLHGESDRIPIQTRARWAMNSKGSTYGPTKSERKNYKIAKSQFDAVRGEVKTLVEDDFTRLQKQLDAAGLPWTSGRPAS